MPRRARSILMLACILGIVATSSGAPALAAPRDDGVEGADAARGTVAAADAPWLPASTAAGIAYFPFAAPPRVERFDLATGTWLPAVPLTDAPTAFRAGDDALFAAYGPRVVRMATDGTGEVSLYAAEWSVIDLLLVAGSLVVAENARLTSVHPVTGAPIGRATFTGVAGLSVAPVARKLFWHSTGVIPNDILWTALNADGTFGGTIESPYHDAYPRGTRTFVLPGERLVADDSGIVYDTAELGYSGSLGGAFTDLTALGDTIVLARPDALVALSSDLIEIGRFVPEAPALAVASDGDVVYTFAVAAPRGVAATAVPLSAFRPRPPAPTVDPSGLAYTPDAIAAGRDGVLYMLSKAHRNVFRWSVPGRSYVAAIPLLDAPEHMAYGDDPRRLFLAYADGSISRILPDDDAAERPFAQTPLPTQGLAVAGPFLFASDRSGGRHTTHFVFAPNGGRISAHEWNELSDAYVWSAVRRRMYYLDDYTIPSELLAEEIDEFGRIAGEFESPYHSEFEVDHPVRVAPDGSVVVLGTGDVYEAIGLRQIRNLSTRIDDAAWQAGRLFTITRAAEGTRVRAWGSDWKVIGERTIDGRPLRIFPADDGLVVVTLRLGVPRFRILRADAGLERIFASAVPPGLALPLTLRDR
ncbi:MAG: hypothetical protein IT332_07195 [Ardenticatenales bacterium]|nr:hypothetical protein [Ardenticatenales bacterium]